MADVETIAHAGLVSSTKFVHVQPHSVNIAASRSAVSSDKECEDKKNWTDITRKRRVHFASVAMGKNGQTKLNISPVKAKEQGAKLKTPTTSNGFLVLTAEHGLFEEDKIDKSALKNFWSKEKRFIVPWGFGEAY